MKKRFLIAVILQVLALNLVVHASVRLLVHHAEGIVVLNTDADTDHPNEQSVPPMDEGERDAPLSESEDDYSDTHSAAIAVLIPIFGSYSFVHTDQQALEGPSSCLLKPPSFAGFLI
jgi:hypothetical protein